MPALVWLTLPLVAIIGFHEGGRDVDPPAELRVLRDVRAQVKSRVAAHELVALELRGPTPPVIGYLMRAGRIRFDVVDDQGRRVRQVFYEDVVAFLDVNTHRRVAVAGPTWAGQLGPWMGRHVM
jgi:hypothetical protein